MWDTDGIAVADVLTPKTADEEASADGEASDNTFFMIIGDLVFAATSKGAEVFRMVVSVDVFVVGSGVGVCVGVGDGLKVGVDVGDLAGNDVSVGSDALFRIPFVAACKVVKSPVPSGERPIVTSLPVSLSYIY